MDNRPAHTVTLDDFIGEGDICHDLVLNDSDRCMIPVGSVDLSRILSPLDILPGLVEEDDVEDYRIAPLLRSATDFALLKKDEDGRWETVGQYADDALLVEPDHRRRRLGACLVLVAAEARGGLPKAREYTLDGFRTHLRAHRLAVDLALQQGWSVPSEVLLCYPTLVDPALDQALDEAHGVALP